MYSYDIKIDIFVLTSNYSFLILWLTMKKTFLSSLNKIRWTHTHKMPCHFMVNLYKIVLFKALCFWETEEEVCYRLCSLLRKIRSSKVVSSLHFSI